MKKFVRLLFTILLLLGFGLAVYFLNENLFFSFMWFFIFASIITPIASRLPSAGSKRVVYLVVLFFGIIWFVLNDKLLQLISVNINSNPYGEYFLAQLEFRLSLSIFVLKVIKDSWLTDIRLLACGILLLMNAIFFPRLLRAIFMRLPGRLFEFFVTVFSHIKNETSHYLSTSFMLAMINGALWCLAGFFLQFDNFILMTFLMIICTFFPRIGLFVAVLLSLLFVESGLFLIQLGGLFIAAASVWFVDHTIFRDQKQITTYIPILVLASLPLICYVFFWILALPYEYFFLGSFMSAPLVHVSALISSTIYKFSSLIHRKSFEMRIA